MSVASPVKKIMVIIEMIKFEHTIFALPFALVSMIVAADGFPHIGVIGWILAAMVGARSAAMAFNRIVDARIDALNPRTCSRAIPAGLVSAATAWSIVIVSSALLVFAANRLNQLAFMLSPIALATVLFYSYSKRFTSLSHVWLGLCLGIAPAGAWIAVTGKMGFPSMVLSAVVMLWTAGFDIIYSLQDLEFDKKIGLYSLPSRLGPNTGLMISRLFHAGMLALLVWFGLLTDLGKVFYAGVALVALFLIYEQSLVAPNDIRRVNAAFFTMNGCISIALLAFVAVDVFI